jgi:nickel-dependent lactate racemase
MPRIELKYGKTTLPLEFDDGRFEILGHDSGKATLTDVQIGEKLDAPVGSRPLEDIVSAGETVLFVVPDATRQTGAGQIVNLLVRRLIAAGTAPHNISIIFATGIHRRVTEEERGEILTPFIAQRIKTLHHDAANPIRNFRVGETSGGIPVELDWRLTEFDHVVLVGGVTFHYFAGFTGGRKLICPGLASAKTVTATHELAFDCELKNRRDGVGTGLLDRNVVHEAFMEAAAFAKPSFCVSTIVDDAGAVMDLYCGGWRESHRAACDAYGREHTVAIVEKRDLVVASCGGYPHDVNMIQAHKTLEAASHACSEGGTIVLLAECSDGLGRSDFIDWFESANPDALAERLCENYQVNGQTAWNLMRRAKKFNIRIVTDLPEEVTRRMKLTKISSESITELIDGSRGYFLPYGAKFLIRPPSAGRP